MHHESRNLDGLQVRGKVSLRERLDAVVMRLRTTHHALAPPILDHALRGRRAGPVVSVEGPTGEVEVELRAIGAKCLAKPIEYFDRQAPWIGGRLHHDRRHGGDQYQLGDVAGLAKSGDVAGCLSAPGRVSD